MMMTNFYFGKPIPFCRIFTNKTNLFFVHQFQLLLRKRNDNNHYMISLENGKQILLPPSVYDVPSAPLMGMLKVDLLGCF